MMNERHEPPPAPQPLDYPSPPLSRYDRPVEPFVTFARRFKMAVRIGYLLFALAVAGLAVWGALRMAGVFDRYSQ
jgi:hypothetical protein